MSFYHLILVNLIARRWSSPDPHEDNELSTERGGMKGLERGHGGMRFEGGMV